MGAEKVLAAINSLLGKTVITVGITVGFICFLVTTGTAVASSHVSNAAIVSAESPIDLNGQLSDVTGQVTDTGKVEAALAKTRQSEYIGYVVLVNSFDGMRSDRWCDKTFSRSELPRNAILMAVAVSDRQYIFCAGTDVSLSGKQKRKIDEHVKAELKNRDFTAAATAFAAALTGATPSDGNGKPTESYAALSSVTGIFVLLFFAGILCIAILLFRRSRSNRYMSAGRYVSSGQKTGQTIAADTSLGLTDIEAVSQASERVLSADAQVRSAQEDLEFARAEFGATIAEQFSSAHKDAMRLRDKAFQALSAMQEAAPQSQDQIASARKAIMLADSVHQSLLPQLEELTKLRTSQLQAGDALSRLGDKASELQKQLPAAQAELQQLATVYAHMDLSSIMDNTQQAESLIQAAMAAATQGATAWKDNDRFTALQYLHLGERALIQAQAQLEAVMRAHTYLEHIDKTLLAAVGSISTDVDEAEKLGLANALKPLLDEAREAITFGQAALHGQQDPLVALEKLSVAEQAIDTALDPHREQAKAQERLRKRNDQKLKFVEQIISDTDAMIQHRRGVVGVRARQYLHSAQEMLQAAKDESDLDCQYGLAQQAIVQMRNARAEIDSDMTELGHGSAADYPMGRGGGFDITSLILGGILFGGSLGNDHDSNDSWSGFGGSYGSGSSSFGGGSF